jgi:hypothetical protein
MSEDYPELDKPEEYFPYVGHDLNQGIIRNNVLYRHIVGSILDEENVRREGDHIAIKSPLRGSLIRRGSLFRQVDVYGVKANRRIAEDPDAVEAIVPRHRTLYDYLLGMPIHHTFVNRELIILAGNNLFVAKFDPLLRFFGGFMFLREDTILERKGLPKVFLSAKRYLEEVFPAYMHQQMLDGIGPAGTKRDLILYAGQEKNPVTGKRSGGRTKTGRLRNLSPLFFERFKHVVKETSTRLYFVPQNISFSKCPDAPFVAHPVEHPGMVQNMRYVGEQSFVTRSYPRFAWTHPNAQLEAVVRYGEPELLTPGELQTTRDLIAYAHRLRDKIGRMETVFPTGLVCRALDNHRSAPIQRLEEACRRLYERYAESGVHLEKVSQREGEMMPATELVERSVRTLNCNPGMFIWGVRHDHLLTFRRGRLVSHDPKLQAWYANNLRHLDPE